jgi:hypothetical protein
VPKIPNCLSGFKDCRLDLLARELIQLTRGIFVGNAHAGRSLEQCRYSRATLDDRVVHFAGDAVSLFDNSLKAQPNTAQSEAVYTVDDCANDQKAEA